VDYINPEGDRAMSKSKINYTLIIALLLACAMQSFGQTVVPATKQQVDKLIAKEPLDHWVLLLILPGFLKE